MENEKIKQIPLFNKLLSAFGLIKQKEGEIQELTDEQIITKLKEQIKLTKSFLVMSSKKEFLKYSPKEEYKALTNSWSETLFLYNSLSKREDIINLPIYKHLTLLVAELEILKINFENIKLKDKTKNEKKLLIHENKYPSEYKGLPPPGQEEELFDIKKKLFGQDIEEKHKEIQKILNFEEEEFNNLKQEWGFK